MNREEYFNRLHEHLGTDSSDESISFLEDMTDTYNDMESRRNPNVEELEQRCRELDEAWKKRYAARFFHGGDSSIPATEQGTASSEETYNPGEVQVADLFS